MISFAEDLDSQLYQTAGAYIKYFIDRAQNQASGFGGLTNSFQIDLGGHSSAAKEMIDHGAASYDQSILARLNLAGGNTNILDTYAGYATPAKLADVNNPLLNCNGNYYGAGGITDKILYGPYRIVRISSREGNWYNSWDWIVDTGAAACLIIDAAEAYEKTGNVQYKDLAVLLAGYITKLKDTDGGIRYGPRGMYHYPEGNSDFYWKLKSTEQNERCLYAMQALYTITEDTQYNTIAEGIKNWLKSMYHLERHLFAAAATFDGSTWVKSDIDGYVPTDVTAFAPLEMMLNDLYFGATQEARDTEAEAMFMAIEGKTGFLNPQGKPVFFRFSVSQSGAYGSVEWSAQMALAYLRAARYYSAKDTNKTQFYLDRYSTLIYALESYFSPAGDDPEAKVAPYASYYSTKNVAGHVPTGTGYNTYNCQAALASAYYVFAKVGYDPCKLGGGTNILNLTGLAWYQNIAPYYSTGAATAQMILNYMRTNTGQPQLEQNTIYEYAKSPQPFGSELNPEEMAKVLGHFDPYDTIISNWADAYDSLPDGNPLQGYNFSVDTYDPYVDPEAMNAYMRDICHWIAYTVTKEDWWLDAELVAQPNTPAAIPIYGTYNHWVAVKGFATNINPCPEPHTNPWSTPDFTVYGLWIKDPLVDGIGQDTYKTAAECQSTYFLPLSTGDIYHGKFVQVAEPPQQRSRATVKIPFPKRDLANLDFIAADTQAENKAGLLRAATLSYSTEISGKTKRLIRKRSWQDIVDPPILFDPEAQAAFNQAQMGKPLLVKRTDIKNANYYLVPFHKPDKQGRLLTSAVIILDGRGGYFKEASWTKTPEQFLEVNKIDAIRLIRNYIVRNFSQKLRELFRTPDRNRIGFLIQAYRRLLSYVHIGAPAELLWEPNSKYSLSPYKPYWKIYTRGYIWYVTQEAKVIPGAALDTIIKEIESNIIYLSGKLPY